MEYVSNMIIRPKKTLYELDDLQDTVFSFRGEEFKRIDFKTQIRNEKGELLSCSLWCPLEVSSEDIGHSPCIIYCHGNVGNKFDSEEILPFLLWEFNIFSFDFSGAGQSEGEYVTLGFFEYLDIKCVVEYLRKELCINKIILYGRSMGAVSSLRYAETDPNIKALILDSPFANFTQLCQEILSSSFYVPKCIASFLVNRVRIKILETIKDFDIHKFIPAENAKKVLVPTIIIHGLQDSLVDIDHSREIYNNLHKNTFKKILEVEGEHNSVRSSPYQETIRDFIIRFAYDPSILKDYKRRLNIRNAQLEFLQENHISIESTVQRFNKQFGQKKLKNFTFDRECNKLRSKSSHVEDESNYKLNKITIHNSEVSNYKKRDMSSNARYAHNINSLNKSIYTNDSVNETFVSINASIYINDKSKDLNKNNHYDAESTTTTSTIQNTQSPDRSFINSKYGNKKLLVNNEKYNSLYNINEDFVSRPKLRTGRTNNLDSLLANEIYVNSSCFNLTTVDKTNMRAKNLNNTGSFCDLSI